MAFDEFLGERITRFFTSQKVEFFSKKMMGGLIFMVNNKMSCGIHIDKKYGDSLLMAKIGEKQYAIEIKKECCLPMDFTGRPMKGYIYITPEGFDLDTDLEYWLELVLSFNRKNN
ncbi:RNA methyltransferase [Flammeovirga pectinis]|uniref:RNA methyltransferase n=1 Tax=Flammeovirga pectinis TaxID=2494373 RepID=A0A3S9P3S8_9BACT|nr:RNA methyltransferase [Flammeovirga pectinis]AZQ62870.1 RNA methyltransferase [Flammeovirga pectinis]